MVLAPVKVEGTGCLTQKSWLFKVENVREVVGADVGEIFGAEFYANDAFELF